MPALSGNIEKMKIRVLTRVAQLAFAGELDDVKDDLPLEFVPGGSQPTFSCCVYLELEILRYRIRWACGQVKKPGVVAVMHAACEGCPINRYTVTSNCRSCTARKCMEACPFGAISVTGRGAYIDPDKCKECGRCAAACPYNAIADTMRPCVRACPVDSITMDQNRHATINYDRCISCGQCVLACPFGAISDESYITQIIDAIKSKKEVYACYAPAIEGQFGMATTAQLTKAVEMLGFDGCVEVSLGADMVAQNEAQELKHVTESGGHMTTSCCPAFFNMINKHFHKLMPMVSSTVSPMTATARYLKSLHPDALVVFIGPCIAKKSEVRRQADGADYVMTFEELYAMFMARDIDPVKVQADPTQEGSIYAKNFAQAGGVSAAVGRVLEEDGFEMPYSCLKCSGAAECKKALMMLGAGRLPETIVEGMACEGGCVNGPGNIADPRVAQRARQKLLAEADKRGVNENLEKIDMTKIHMERY